LGWPAAQKAESRASGSGITPSPPPSGGGGDLVFSLSSGLALLPLSSSSATKFSRPAAQHPFWAGRAAQKAESRARTKTYLALTQPRTKHQAKQEQAGGSGGAAAAMVAQSSVGPLLASASPAANISGPAAQKSTQQQQALTSCTVITNNASEQKSKPVWRWQLSQAASGFWLLPRRPPKFLSLRRRRAHSNSRH
jgi:hypothetical protein